MEARIGTSYSPTELQAISRELVRLGVLTEAEAAQNEPLAALTLTFFDLNCLLQPALGRLAYFSNDARKGWFDQRETAYFYEWFALLLLRGCPLRHHQPTCHAATPGGPLVLGAGTAGVTLAPGPRTHPKFIEQLVQGVNYLLRQHGFTVGYYELAALDETTWFVLLTPGCYEQLLRERLLYFAGVEYPEITAWRRTLRAEDLLF